MRPLRVVLQRTYQQAESPRNDDKGCAEGVCCRVALVGSISSGRDGSNRDFRGRGHRMKPCNGSCRRCVSDSVQRSMWNTVISSRDYAQTGESQGRIRDKVLSDPARSVTHMGVCSEVRSRCKVECQY